MSYNGSGTFVINTAGQPVVSGTVISSTAFNALTADLATGLSTCITKDGQTTVTANIPMGNNKITGLAVGTAATDAANLSQVQSTAAKLINSISGADTVTGVLSPTLGAYAAGQMFYWVAAGDNTGAVTLNIDSLGAKSVTRDGSVALAAGDIKSGEVVVVVYDGTRFQVVSQLNSAGDARFANVSIASALNVGGVATFTGGTANGVTYLNGSKVLTSGTALTFDGTNFATTGNSRASGQFLAGSTGAATPDFSFIADNTLGIFRAPNALGFSIAGSEQMRLTSTGLGIGTSSPTAKLHVWQTGAATSLNIDGTENPIFAARYAANADGATIFLAKSRNATVGSHTIVQNGDELGVIKARGSDGTNFDDAASITFAVDGTPSSGSDMPGRIVFGTSADGTASITERARITSGGAFLVGATATASYLDGAINGKVTGSTSAICAQNPTATVATYTAHNTATSGDNSFHEFGTEAGFTTRGSIKYNRGGGVVAYNTTSDYRAKDVYGPIEDAGDTIDALKVYRGKMKGATIERPMMVAHEAQEVVPYAVTGEKDAVKDDGTPIYQQMDHAVLVPLLIAEIQSLRARVAQLEAK